MFGVSFCLRSEMKRERERVDNDDDPDVMPLSKRMNNIHFDGTTPVNLTNGLSNNGPLYNGSSDVISNTNNSPQNGSVASISHLTHDRGSNSAMNMPNSQLQNGLISRVQYSPGLSRIENPVYYDQNKALFELYKERLLRNNYPPHPNFGNE